MAEENNSRISSTKDNPKNNKSKQKRSRNKTTPRPYGTTPKQKIMQRHAEQIKRMENKALERFSISPPLIGFPDEVIEPKNFSFDWPTSPISLKVEAEMAKLVVRKGEFGWLDDARVDEIGEIVKTKEMSLEQLCSVIDYQYNAEDYLRLLYSRS